MVSNLLVGLNPDTTENISSVKNTPDNHSIARNFNPSARTMSLTHSDKENIKDRPRQEHTTATEEVSTAGNYQVLSRNLGTTGGDSDINPDCRKESAARTSTPLLADMPGLQLDMSSETPAGSGRKGGSGRCDNVISPSSTRKRASSHSHGRRRGEGNTSGDRIRGETKLEIGPDLLQPRPSPRGANINGEEDRGHLPPKSDDITDDTGTDRTAVDSLKAVHAQKKFFIRSAIWDENGDIGACTAPTLPDGSHQKLRLCRSLDPDLLTSATPEQTYHDESGPPAGGGPIRTGKTGSLRVRPTKPKRFLRSIKSVDSVIPKSLEADNNIDSSSGTHFGRLFSSPSTRRRFAYFSKLAAGMKTTSVNPPSHQGDNDSQDLKSSPPSPPPAGLTRGKTSGSPSSSVKRMPRKLFKARALKPASYETTLQSTWIPQGNGLWQNTKGRRYQLYPKPLIHLSDVERRHLKLVAQQKLQHLNLGQVNIPRDLSEFKKKKGGLLKGGKNKATNFLDSLQGKDSKDSAPLIFGIPLEKCLQNDQELREIEAQRSHERRESLDLAVQPGGLQARRRSSRSLHSPQLSRRSSASSTALLEALSLSSSLNESHRRARRASLTPNVDLKIPRVVSACFRFIETNGLRTEGIFRVSGSKKRVRQMREAYDSGDAVIFTRDQSPHDVGALLKEYFRDLPEPLLTRDLYNIFTSVTKFDTDAEQIDIVRLAVCLLPIVHRDMLYALMRFLSRVAAVAEKDLDSQGNEITGSKMNVTNLGTLFGPNILRKTKGGLTHEKDKDFVDAASHVERTRDVIISSCLLIRHYEEIFQIPVSLQEEVLRTIADTDPDALDFILNRRSYERRIAEEPSKEEPPALPNNGSIMENTSSSSGTFPCVIDDSSLASLSTIEDLVSGRNLSDFDANIPSIGSSDSFDALDSDDMGTRGHEPETITSDRKVFYYLDSNGDAYVQTHEGKLEQLHDGEKPPRICNGSVVDPEKSSSGGVFPEDDDETETEGGLAPPHLPLKRGSIGLYRETMLALGMDDDSRRGLADEQNDVNSNGPNVDCMTCAQDGRRLQRGFPPPVLPQRRKVHSSSVSSSPMSGSTSSSNASLVHVDHTGVDSKKKLPNYEEFLRIKELGVKNYVTVNSSKYFVPLPQSDEGAKIQSDVNGIQPTVQETQADHQHGDEYSNIRRRDAVKRGQHRHGDMSLPYGDTPNVITPSVGSPSLHVQDMSSATPAATDISPRASGGAHQVQSMTSSGVPSRTVNLPKDRLNDVRCASTPNIPSEAAANAANRNTSQRTITPSKEHETPLLAWDHHAPKEMGRTASYQNVRKLSREIMGELPKVSMYNSWSFLDLRDDDGEFDGPETYV